MSTVPVSSSQLPYLSLVPSPHDKISFTKPLRDIIRSKLPSLGTFLDSLVGRFILLDVPVSKIFPTNVLHQLLLVHPFHSDVTPPPPPPPWILSLVHSGVSRTIPDLKRDLFYPLTRQNSSLHCTILNLYFPVTNDNPFSDTHPSPHVTLWSILRQRLLDPPRIITNSTNTASLTCRQAKTHTTLPCRST